MIVVRFKVQCQPDKTGQVRAACEESIGGESEATIFHISSSEPWGD
jgi:hypothetical protein